MKKFADGTNYETMLVVYPPRDFPDNLWTELTDEQSNDSYRMIHLKPGDFNYPKCPKVIKWLKSLGIKEKHVFVSICW